MLKRIDKTGTYEVIKQRAMFLRNMKDLCVPLQYNYKLYDIKGIRIEPVADDEEQFELWVCLKGR